MKGIITTIGIVAVGGAAFWLWKKAHENEEVEIPEEETEMYYVEK